MRILMVSGTPVWSLGEKKGAASFYNTLRGYTDNGHHVTLFIGNRADGISGPNLTVQSLYFPLWAKLGVTPKIGLLFRLVWWVFFQIAAFAWGLWAARRQRFDIVYGYEIHGVPAAVLLGRVLRRPSVARFQGTIMKSGMTVRLWRLRLWDHYVALKSPANLIIMANDGTEGDRVLVSLGVDPDRVRFWMNGVDRSFLEPVPEAAIAQIRDQLGLSSEDPVLLTLSRLVHWKRLDRIIMALPKILEHNPKVRLVVVGDGESRNEYEHLVERLGLSSAVTFTGAVSHQDTKRYLALADIFVSLYDLSNVGNPLLEAMMMGKCIVTLDVGATKSIMENGVNGVLLSVEELTSLPSVITRLLEDNSMRQKLGHCAQDQARRQFWDWPERMKAEITEVCKLLP